MFDFDEFDEILESLGIDPTEATKTVAEKPAAPKKAEKKPEKKAEKKPEKSAAPKKPEKKISFPLTVIVGTGVTIELTADEAGEAKTMDAIVDLVCARRGYEKDVVTSKYLDERKIIVCLNRAKAKAKGEFKIEATTVIKVGDEEYSAAEIEGSRTKDELIKFVSKVREDKEDLPYVFIEGKEKIYALIGEAKAYGDVRLPVKVIDIYGNAIVITEEDLKDVKLPDETDAEGEEEDVVVTDGEVEVEAIKKLVFESERYATSREALTLYRPNEPKKDENVLYLALDTVLAYTAPNSSEPKKPTMYPTNATISLLFTRIPLTPEMFGGKKEVEAKEIFAVLQKEKHEEFTESRARLRYDKDGNFIFPEMKSSTKGADVFCTREDAMAAAQDKEYYICDFLHCDKMYRFEKTFVSETEATKTGEGRFRWKLPKIPMKMLASIEDFFRKVSLLYGTEALVWICWNPKSKSYFFVLPEQRVTKTMVTTDNTLLSVNGSIRVMDFHSHNSMPAFFSSVDNADEVGNLLYGVMGMLVDEDSEPMIEMRAGTGGRFVKLAIDDIFGESDEEVETGESLFDEWQDFAVQWQ